MGDKEIVRCIQVSFHGENKLYLARVSNPLYLVVMDCTVMNEQLGEKRFMLCLMTFEKSVAPTLNMALPDKGDTNIYLKKWW